MANSYATVPAIIPGNLTVQGNLTVAGSYFTFGQLQRKYRLWEQFNGQFLETVNLTAQTRVQDDPSINSVMRVLGVTGVPLAVATQSAGVPGVDNYIFQVSGGALWLQLAELRLGAAFPYLRLYNAPPNNAVLSVNLQSDGITRDDSTSKGMALTFQDASVHFGTKVVDPAGNAIAADLRRVFWLDHTPRSLTGVTGPQTITSKIVFGNQLGVSGGIHLLVQGVAIAAAGGQVQLGITFGAVTTQVLVVPASVNAQFVAEVFIQNINATNSQQLASYAAYTGAQGQTIGNILAADTTVNQNLAITYTPALAGDQIVVRAIESAFISRSAGI